MSTGQYLIFEVLFSTLQVHGKRDVSQRTMTMHKARQLRSRRFWTFASPFYGRRRRRLSSCFLWGTSSAAGCRRPSTPRALKAAELQLSPRRRRYLLCRVAPPAVPTVAAQHGHMMDILTPSCPPIPTHLHVKGIQRRGPGHLVPPLPLPSPLAVAAAAAQPPRESQPSLPRLLRGPFHELRYLSNHPPPQNVFP